MPDNNTYFNDIEVTGYSYGANIQGIIPVILEPQDEIDVQGSNYSLKR